MTASAAAIAERVATGPATSAGGARPSGGIRGLVRAVARLLGASLDGFVAGFAIAYVVATALSGVGRHLGYGAAGDVVANLALVLAAVGITWGTIAGLVVAARRARDRLRASPRVGRLPGIGRRVVVLPFAIVGAVELVGMALMAAILLLVYVAAPSGAGGLLGPDGAFAPFLWYAAIAGAGIGLARRAWIARRAGSRSRLHAVAVAIGAAVAVAAGGYGAWSVVDPGSTAHLVAADPAFDGPAVPTTLDDPGARGPYPVATWSYGSGTDRRPPYGSEARLVTPTVDASRALDPLGPGADAARRASFGFGTDALPLNARVWEPEGDGPFPLVLIVHGNHAMGAPSEAGYAGLAETLASQGFIAASIDETFLNGSWADDWSGGEQDVRAWLLLLHLDQWRTWNADPASPLHDRVDLGRVALVGHSRGGEAAAVAASLRTVGASAYPLLRPWPEGLEVRAVVAIAPSDGQFGGSVRLRDVDYLTLTGGHDADAMAWSGIRQYGRTTLRPGGFKAAVYAYRANHGQFNTEWGRGDHGPWSGGLLNLAPLPDAADQEDVAATVIGAFLRASLRDEDGYRAFFRRPITGREWLPADDVYVVRSDEGTGIALVEAATTGRPVAGGGRAVTEGLGGAGAADLPLRALQSTQDARGTFLGWTAGPGEARWGVEGLATQGTPPGAGAMLRIELADATPVDPADPAATEPLEVVIELTAADGVRVALPLSTWGALPPPLPARLAKSDLSAALARVSALDLSLRSPAEIVPQTWWIPIDAFAATDPAFDPARLDAVVLRVPRTRDGRLVVTAVELLPAS